MASALTNCSHDAASAKLDVEPTSAKLNDEAMATVELEIMSLAGTLCTIKAGQDWRLHDLHQAVAASTGIPADEQRLVAGASILAPRTMLLVELLPEGITDVLCVRCQTWVVIPLFSTCPFNPRPLGRRQRCAEQGERCGECLTIEEAKLRCTDEAGVWGFTFAGCKEDERWANDEGNGFKAIGTGLGLHNTGGITYVHLTPAGREVILQALREKKNGGKRVIMDRIRDLEVILAAVEEDAQAFRFVCDDLRCNTQVAEIAVNTNPFALQHAPDSVKNNHSILSMAVQKNGFALQYASEELKANRELVLLAINSEPSALRYASEALRADSDICLAAVRQNGNILRYADAQMQNRRDIAIAAVQQAGEALCWVSRPLRSDPEVIATAVKQNRGAREYALPVVASAA